jgi:ribosomal-protein-alanine N-acetyltransferase
VAHGIQSTRYYLRWLIRMDIPTIEEIETSTRDPWDTSRIMGALRERDQIGFVAEYGNRVIGWMIYKLRKRRLDLLRLTVDPTWRRQGVGRQLVSHLVKKIEAPHSLRTSVRVDVPEELTEVLLLLKSLRFQGRMQRGADTVQMIYLKGREG